MRSVILDICALKFYERVKTKNKAQLRSGILKRSSSAVWYHKKKLNCGLASGLGKGIVVAPSRLGKGIVAAPSGLGKGIVGAPSGLGKGIVGAPSGLGKGIGRLG